MASVTWRCRRTGCDWTAPDEGTCPRHRRPLVPDLPDSAEAQDDNREQSVGPESAAAAVAQERLALKMPWRQQINLPDSGSLVLGRSSKEFRDNPDAGKMSQVSRVHARFFRDAAGGLHVEDLDSLNGTYVDGVPAEQGGSAIQAGQVLRLGLDIECDVIRLNEHGEPED
jgi:hypothetical protein